MAGLSFGGPTIVGDVSSGVGPSSSELDQVIGVELEVSHVFQDSLRAGHLVEIEAGESIADGLGGNADPETITFELIQRYVDRIVTVSEDDLAAAIVGLVEKEHLVAEGAGAAASAAILSKRVDVSGRKVAAIVSGSNIDRNRLMSVLANHSRA